MISNLKFYCGLLFWVLFGASTAWLIGLAIAKLWLLAAAATPAEFFCSLKRGFYSVCMMAIFFYTARTIRAVAKFFEAKARQTEDAP
jgi:hypothetical protein